MAEKLRTYEEGLYTSADAFDGSYIEYATLHVPAASIPSYKSMEPWSKFKSVVAIGENEIPETPKCATPTITYKDGKLSFTCETEGAEFVSNISVGETGNHYDSEITIGNVYTVTVHATKAGFDDSEIATLSFTASGLQGDVNGDGKVDVADHVKLSDIILNQQGSE